MPAVSSPFQKQAPLDPILELGSTEEEILSAVHLIQSSRPSGGGYGEDNAGELSEKAGYQSAFARPRRPGDDDQPRYHRTRLCAGQSTSISISSLR